MTNNNDRDNARTQQGGDTSGSGQQGNSGSTRQGTGSERDESNAGR